MKIKFLLLTILCFFIEVIYGQSGIDTADKKYYPVRDRMLVNSLDGTWKFKFLDGLSIPSDLIGWEKSSYKTENWDNINVPGNWETQGFKTPQYGRDLGEYTGLYRKSFQYDPSWKNKHVILRLDGIHFGYECFINGKKVGEYGSAFNLRQFDITPFLNTDGENIIAIKVNTRTFGWQFDTNDCWSLGGITRGVEIFTLDNIYVEDVTFLSNVLPDNNASIKVKVETGLFKSNNEKYQISVFLSDPLHNHVLDFSETIKDKNKIYQFEGILNRPKLWNAETPNLYNLEICIRNSKNIIVQRITERVGIRSVSVDGFDLKVNNTPVLLRGVCLNEIDPKAGRALTYRERRKQLEMIKDANINFIRTAHYPFGPEFLQLCDEMGFYVCEEIPFGYGDENLKKEEYIPELTGRAEATIRRDKNSPSVIMWSVGNENPYTPIVEEVLKYVKKKDYSRPRGLAQKGHDMVSFAKKGSENADLLMGHYLGTERLNNAISDVNKPVILTEYAHSLGLSFDELESQYSNIIANPKIVGGAVWCWSDQAVLTSGKVQIEGGEKQVSKDDDNTLPQFSKAEQGVWLDQEHYMNNFGNNGTDGIVYGNGYPQEDYYQVRKVYSPIIITSENFSVKSGTTHDFEVKLINRYDFKSLNGYQIHWQLMNVNKLINEGKVWLQTLPQKEEKVNLSATIPSELNFNDLMLAMQIIDPSGKSIYEKNIPIEIEGHPKTYQTEIVKIPVDKKLKIVSNKSSINVKSKNLNISFSDNGLLSIHDAKGNVIAETPLYLRVGRPLTVSLEYQGLKNKFYWNPYILSPVIESFVSAKTKDGVQIKTNCRWNRIDKKDQFISGLVIINIYNNGTLNVAYELLPSDNASDNILECGLTLKLDNTFNTFRWLGKGPFTDTPGKTLYNERALWSLHKDDLRFSGNRGMLDLAVVTDTAARAFGIAVDNGNVGVENINGSIFISQNIVVAGYGTKFTKPKQLIEAWKLNGLKGSFTVFIDQPAKPSPFLNNIFKSYSTIVPEQPFLKSYGW